MRSSYHGAPVEAVRPEEVGCLLAPGRQSRQLRGRRPDLRMVREIATAAAAASGMVAGT